MGFDFERNYEDTELSLSDMFGEIHKFTVTLTINCKEANVNQVKRYSKLFSNWNIIQEGINDYINLTDFICQNEFYDKSFHEMLNNVLQIVPKAEAFEFDIYRYTYIQMTIKHEGDIINEILFNDTDLLSKIVIQYNIRLIILEDLNVKKFAFKNHFKIPMIKLNNCKIKNYISYQSLCSTPHLITDKDTKIVGIIRLTE